MIWPYVLKICMSTLGAVTVLDTLLSSELSNSEVYLSHFKASEWNKSARILARIEFKNLTFNKFKKFPPFLQLPILEFDWLLPKTKNISLIS